MSQPDWRQLLVRYMAHILDLEGTTYVRDGVSYLADPLTSEELRLLKEIVPEADAIHQKPRRPTAKPDP